MFPYSLWIIISAWLVCTGWILSFCHYLNGTGYLVSLVLLSKTLLLWTRYGSQKNTKRKKFLIQVFRKRFSRPLPLVYFLCLLLAFSGGAFHAPNNYDALCYRLPRVLHWWSESQWHWIGGENDRMDFSALGFEWLMAPLIMLFKSDRLLFLINLISYALLPGLIYSTFAQLGVSQRVAWCWMWILPCAYCFALQAGSVGNDGFAAVYFLSAVVFAGWARRTASFRYSALALISMALLTGAKASNLPLILPLLLVMVPLIGILIKRPILMMLVSAVTIAVSFFPTAVITRIHTGVFEGDPLNKHLVKLQYPLAGVLGNSMQIGVGAIAPPIFPAAKRLNEETARWLCLEPQRFLRNNFPRLDLSLGEIPMEEAAGLGLGVTLLLGLSFCAVLFRGNWRLNSQVGFLFGVLCWVALGAYMTKLGSESAARLVSAYYPGLFLPLLLFQQQRRLVGSAWWRMMALFSQLAVVPAMILSPARPLVPVPVLISFVKDLNAPETLVTRISKVYSVYGRRSDSLAVLRESLSAGCRRVGFAGTGNESEYSLWKPLGARNVVDSGTASTPEAIKGLDCIVGSEEGIASRFKLSAEDYARSIGGRSFARNRFPSWPARNPTRGL